MKQELFQNQISKQVLKQNFLQSTIAQNQKRKSLLSKDKLSRRKRTTKTQFLLQQEVFFGNQNTVEQKYYNKQMEQSKNKQHQVVKFGDIVQIRFLEYEYQNEQKHKQRQQKQGIVFGGVIENQKLYGKLIQNNQINDEWTNQSLFQIVPKPIYQQQQNNQNDYEKLLLDDETKKLEEIIKTKKQNNNELQQNEIKYMDVKIVYGDVILLRHVITGLYLTLDDWNIKQSEHGLKIFLKQYIEQSNCFRITSLSRINQQGQAVHYSDQILLSKYKEENLYLGIKQKKTRQSLLLSTKKFQWNFYQYDLRNQDEAKSCISLKYGDIVNIHHKITQQNLTANPMFGEDYNNHKKEYKFNFKNGQKEEDGNNFLEQNFLNFNRSRKFQIYFNNKDQNNLYDLWEVKGTCQQENKCLKENDRFYLKSFLTGLFLVLNSENQFQLVRKEYLQNYQPYQCCRNFQINQVNNVNIKENYCIKQNNYLMNININENIRQDQNFQKEAQQKIKEFQYENELNTDQNMLFQFKKIKKTNKFSLQQLYLKNYFIEFYEYLFFWGTNQQKFDKQRTNILYVDYCSALNEIGNLITKEKEFRTKIDLLEEIFLFQDEEFYDINKIFVLEQFQYIFLEIINYIVTRLYKSFQNCSKDSKKNKCLIQENSQTIGVKQFNSIAIKILNFLSSFSKKNIYLLQQLQKEENYIQFINWSYFYFKPCNKIIYNISQYVLNQSHFSQQNSKFSKDIISIYLKKTDSKTDKNIQFIIYKNLKIYNNLTKICLKFENYEYFKKLVNLLIPFEYLEQIQFELIEDKFIQINIEDQNKYSIIKQFFQIKGEQKSELEETQNKQLKINLQDISQEQTKFFEIIFQLYSNIMCQQIQQLQEKNMKIVAEYLETFQQVLPQSFIEKMFNQSLKIQLKIVSLNFLKQIEKNDIQKNISEIIENKVIFFDNKYLQTKPKNLHQFFQIDNQNGNKIQKNLVSHQYIENIKLYIDEIIPYEICFKQKTSMENISFQQFQRLLKYFIEFLIYNVNKGYLQTDQLNTYCFYIISKIEFLVRQYLQNNYKDNYILQKLLKLYQLYYQFVELIQKNFILKCLVDFQQNYNKKPDIFNNITQSFFLTNQNKNYTTQQQNFDFENKNFQSSNSQKKNITFIAYEIENLLIQNQKSTLKIKFVEYLKQRKLEKISNQQIKKYNFILISVQRMIQKIISTNFLINKSIKDLKQNIFFYDDFIFNFVNKENKIYYQSNQNQKFIQICQELYTINSIFQNNQFSLNMLHVNTKKYFRYIRIIILLLNEFKKQKIFFYKLQMYLYYMNVFEFAMNMIVFIQKLYIEREEYQKESRSFCVLLIDLINLIIQQNDFLKSKLLKYFQNFYDLISQDVNCYWIIQEILLVQYDQDKKSFLQKVQNQIINLNRYSEQIDIINKVLTQEKIQVQNTAQYKKFRQFNIELKILGTLANNIQNDKNVKQIIFFDILQKKIIQNLIQPVPNSFKENLSNMFQVNSEKYIIMDIIENFYDLMIDLLRGYDHGIKCFQNILTIDSFVHLIFKEKTEYFFKNKILQIFSILFMHQIVNKKEDKYLFLILDEIRNDIYSFPYFLNQLLPESQYQQSQIDILIKSYKSSNNKQLAYEQEMKEHYLNLQINLNDYWNYLHKNNRGYNYGLINVLNNIFKIMLLQNYKKQVKQCIDEIQDGLIYLRNILDQLQKDNKNLNLMKYIYILNQSIFLYKDKFQRNKTNINFQLKQKNQQIQKILEEFRNYLCRNQIDFHYYSNQIMLDTKLSPENKFQKLLKDISLQELLQEVKKEFLTYENGISQNDLQQKDVFVFFQYLEVELFNIQYYQEQFIIKNDFEFTQGLQQYFAKVEHLNQNNKSDILQQIHNNQIQKDLAKNKLNQESKNQFIQTMISTIKACILKKNQVLNKENLFDITINKKFKNNCGYIFYSLNKIIQQLENNQKENNHHFNQDNLVNKDKQLQKFLKNIYDQQIINFCLQRFIDQQDLTTKNNILILLFKILDIIETEAQDKILLLFINTKTGTQFIQELLKLYRKIKQLLLEKDICKIEKVNDELSYYQLDCQSIFYSILEFFQKLSDNCHKGLQLVISGQTNIKQPVNFLKKVIDFFANYSKKLIQNQKDFKNETRLIVNENQIQKEKQSFALLTQLYKTVEELTMGPCEENMIQVINNQNLMMFIQEIINYKTVDLKQNQLISEIFSICVDFLFLLFMTDGIIQKQICKLDFKFQALQNILVDFYFEYIKDHTKNLEFELYCDSSDDQYNIKSDITYKLLEKYTKTNSCNNCNYQECNQGKISEQQRKYVRLCQKIYQILKIKNYIQTEYSEEQSVEKNKKNSIQNYSESHRKYEAIKYFSKYEEQVELYYNEQIIKYKFVVPYICFFINNDLVIQIINQTDRSSHDEKLQNFIDKLQEFIEIMKQQQQLSRVSQIKMIFDNEKKVYNFRLLITIFLNFFIMYTLKYESENDLIVKDDYDQNNLISLLRKKQWIFIVYIFFCSFVLLVILAEVLINIVNNLPKIKCRYKDQDLFALKNFKNRSRSKKVWQIIKIIFNLLSFSNILLITASCMAFFIPWFWGVILLDVVFKNKEMHDIIRSVTENSTQLLKTIFLAIIVMYIYSFVAFSYFPNDFQHDESQDFKNYCNSLWSCFVSTFYNGIRAGGGIGEALGHLNRESDHYWIRLFFDLSFFLVIIVCLLNIIFGIIIDTFADLRDQRNELKKVILTRCFICEQEKYKIESIGEGWSKHIKKSHNIKKYLKFLVFISQKKLDDCSSLEKHIKQSLQVKDYSFIPYLVSSSTFKKEFID